MRRWLSILLRALVAGFCWLTAVYALVAASPFAYLQFLKPRVFAWVGHFADWHAWMLWIWCLALAVSVAPDVRRAGASRFFALLLAGASAAAAIWNTFHPVVPSLTDTLRSLTVGVVALVPILGLSLLDHIEAAAFLRRQREPASLEGRRSIEGRMLLSATGSVFLIVIVYAALASFRISRAFEPDLMTAGGAIGVGVAILDHFLIFVAAFLALTMLGRLSARAFVVHYVLLFGALSGAFALAFARLIGDSIGLSGAGLWVAAAGVGVSIVATWGGLRLRSISAANAPLTSAIDIFIAPPPGQFNGRLASTLLLPFFLAYALAAVAGRIDWDFLLLKVGVFAVWVATFVIVCRVTPRQPLGSIFTATICAVPLAAHALIPVGPDQTHVLERYAVYNPSFLLADSIVRRQEPAPSFDRYLRANTGLTDVSVAPVSIDFVHPLSASPEPKPLIFLFVIDSLRTDYLSPYNPQVTFTPRFKEFADANVRFANAFARYGGTGLSMPAMWAGSALAHKQYVLPFAPMNALEKLLDANGYTTIMSRDHITAELWHASAPAIELDRGRPEMEFDFCRTLSELGSVLEGGRAIGPIFAQTRSLNLHVAAVRNGYVPQGKTYPGFDAPYAWRVEQMDTCFGSFVDLLKRLQLYSRSVIVLTADHGELIGENGRWGHSYYMVPEVIQIPLLMHLPEGVNFYTDVGNVALSTDITPTLYAALGYSPEPSNDLMGKSLLDTSHGVRDRQSGSYVLAASYGAVYAVVSQNGRRVYVADAIKGQDHAYARGSDGTWSERDVDAGTRTVGQMKIRRHVDEIARVYHLDPQF